MNTTPTHTDATRLADASPNAKRRNYSPAYVLGGE